MFRIRAFSPFVLFTCIVSFGQTQPNGSASTTGSCSPANTGNSNTFVINCGIGRQQGSEMVRILNKILAKQIDPSAVMAKLDEIGKDVKGLRRGVYSGYDFNGARRQQTPGRIGVIVGAEFGVFQQMAKLHMEKEWAELLKLADDQIDKTPDWLTPYLYSGVANLQLGNREIGIARLQFVVTEAAGDPAYADASRILGQLGK